MVIPMALEDGAYFESGTAGDGAGDENVNAASPLDYAGYLSRQAQDGFIIQRTQNQGGQGSPPRSPYNDYQGYTDQAPRYRSNTGDSDGGIAGGVARFVGDNILIPAAGLLAAPIIADVAWSKMSGQQNVRWNLTRGAMRWGGRAVRAVARSGGQLLSYGAREGFRLARANPRGALIVGGIVAAGAGCVYLYNRLSSDDHDDQPRPVPRQPQHRPPQPTPRQSDVQPPNQGPGERGQNGPGEVRRPGQQGIPGVPDDSSIGPNTVQRLTPQQEIDNRHRDENARRQEENQIRHGQRPVPTPPWQRQDGSMQEVQAVPQPIPSDSSTTGGDALSRLLQRQRQFGR